MTWIKLEPVSNAPVKKVTLNGHGRSLRNFEVTVQPEAVPTPASVTKKAQARARAKARFEATGPRGASGYKKGQKQSKSAKRNAK